MKQYLSFAILIELSQKKFLTAKYLSEKFEISKRTVYRLLSDLESAGIHTYTKKGKNGGIGLEKSFALDALLLNNQDKMFLKNLLENTKSESSTNIMQKLGL